MPSRKHLVLPGTPSYQRQVQRARFSPMPGLAGPFRTTIPIHEREGVRQADRLLLALAPADIRRSFNLHTVEMINHGLTLSKWPKTKPPPCDNSWQLADKGSSQETPKR